ncbi:hypothetical protein GGR57DRAFT_516324 [Xylariaceae sp. FL1272]|nr:hypothetical protein GGR57DRAFT_516324 [Xylariaceae sp. FL1272]
MLQTWNLKSLNETHPQQSFDPETARPVAQQACDSCRIKKLRCSGQKAGCSRCHALSQKCVYAEPGTRGRGRKRKSDAGASGTDAITAKHDEAAPQLQTATATDVSPPVPMAIHNSQPHTTPQTTMDLLVTPDTSHSLTPHLFSSFTQTSDPTKSGVSVISTATLADRDAGSASQIFSPPTPQAGDFADGVDAFSTTTHLWAFDLIGDGSPRLTQSTVGNSSFRSEYDDVEVPYTPSSILSLLQFATSDPHPHVQPQVPGPEPLQAPKEPHHPLDQPPQTACQCLQRVILLLEELECIHDETAVYEPGECLSRLKESVRCGEALLVCPKCQVKAENISILGFLTDRLTTMCTLMVNRYGEVLKSGQSDGTIGAAHAAWRISFGEFEIRSISEWDVLVRAMLMMQLGTLGGLISRLKGISGDLTHRKTFVTQARIAKLLNKIAHPLAN